MNNLAGKKWGELTTDIQECLLNNCNVWAEIEEGECIVDLTEYLSIAGTIIKNEDEKELIINDEAVIYNPFL